MRNHLISTLSLTFILAGAAIGCDDKKEGSDKTAKKSDKPEKKSKGDEADKKPDKKADAKKEPEPAKPEAREMIDHDLSTADPRWKGWVAQGPKEAKVMKDGVKGARIAAGGRGKPQWDVSWAPKKKDLKVLKTNIQKGADASDGKMTLTITKDEPGHVEWMTEGYGSKSYSFTLHMKAEGEDVTCQNNIMVGIKTEEERALYIASCATLKKKA